MRAAQRAGPWAAAGLQRRIIFCRARTLGIKSITIHSAGDTTDYENKYYDDYENNHDDTTNRSCRCIHGQAVCREPGGSMRAGFTSRGSVDAASGAGDEPGGDRVSAAT